MAMKLDKSFCFMFLSVSLALTVHKTHLFREDNQSNRSIKFCATICEHKGHCKQRRCTANKSEPLQIKNKRCKQKNKSCKKKKEAAANLKGTLQIKKNTHHARALSRWDWVHIKWAFPSLFQTPFCQNKECICDVLYLLWRRGSSRQYMWKMRGWKIYRRCDKALYIFIKFSSSDNAFRVLWLVHSISVIGSYTLVWPYIVNDYAKRR